MTSIYKSRILLGFFIMAFLQACQNRAQLEQSDLAWKVSDVVTKVERVYNLPWKVGRAEKKDISMGFVIEFNVPTLASDDAKELIKKYKVNSWIFKVEKVRGGLPMTYGYVSVPFKNINKSLSTTSIKIYYAAAAASGRFRSFECPAFKHRKKIKDYDVSYGGNEETTIFVKYKNKIKSRVHTTKFFPVSFNGGLKLAGDYMISMTLFSSADKKIYGKFKPLDGIIKIQSEEEVHLPSCAGIREENKPDNSAKGTFDIRNLQFNKK
ncbi:hypothetical protein N9N67_06260 [Bacteriovoracaceae bacterium]|nr:hypothetical protein [Bacteriovoracaceae bacterium]